MVDQIPNTYIDAAGRTLYGQLGATKAEVDALSAAMPKPAITAPLSERTGAAIGATDSRYALADHQHGRLTSTTYATIGSNGQATVEFSRSFVNKPGLNVTETDATASSQPIVARGLGWVQDSNNLYIGVTIQASRAQMLPTITPLSGLLTLVSGVVTGVNGIVSQLTGYNIFGGSAVGASISVIAIARSDVPSN